MLPLQPFGEEDLEVARSISTRFPMSKRVAESEGQGMICMCLFTKQSMSGDPPSFSKPLRLVPGVLSPPPALKRVVCPVS